MKTNIVLNLTDTIVLLVLAVFLIAGIRAVVSFFKTPDVKRNQNKKSLRSLFKRRSGEEVTLVIDGMMCGMCEAHIKDIIRSAVPTATDVNASHTKGYASFRIQPSEKPENLKQTLTSALDALGYQLTSMN